MFQVIELATHSFCAISVFGAGCAGLLALSCVLKSGLHPGRLPKRVIPPHRVPGELRAHCDPSHR
jgi:hypothetical protein